MTQGIARNVSAVRRRIAEACARVGRDPSAIRLIAVTKTQGPEVLAPLAAAGVTDFGENRLEHLETLVHALPAGCAFHYIGRIQGRQLAGAAARCVCLHSLCDPSHLPRLARACAAAGLRRDIFLQVNTSGEGAKAGVEPSALGGLLDAARSHPELSVLGLMTMAPELGTQADGDSVRRCFAALRELGRQHGLPRLSMGMSLDYEIAVEEGATDLRIGTALFAA